MCEAIREFVEREERREEQREERRRAAIEAWTDYEVTGRHVNGAQVDDWLAGLESGRDAEGMPCNT